MIKILNSGIGHELYHQTQLVETLKFGSLIYLLTDFTFAGKMVSLMWAG